MTTETPEMTGQQWVLGDLVCTKPVPFIKGRITKSHYEGRLGKKVQGKEVEKK